MRQMLKYQEEIEILNDFVNVLIDFRNRYEVSTYDEAIKEYSKKIESLREIIFGKSRYTLERDRQLKIS